MFSRVFRSLLAGGGIALIVVCAMQGCRPGTGKTGRGNIARTAVRPARAIDLRISVVLWKRPAPGAVISLASVGNTCVVRTSDQIDLVSAQTGQLLWKRNVAPASKIVIPPDESDYGAIYDPAGHIAVFRLLNGSDIWNSAASRWLTPLVTPSRHLLCLSNDGHVLWHNGREQTVASAIAPPGPGGYCIADDSLICTVDKGVISAYSRETGEAAWKLTFRNVTIGKPILAGNNRLISQDGSAIVCRDFHTSGFKWSLPEYLGPDPGICAYDRFLYLSSRSEIQCIDTNTGISVWKSSLPALVQEPFFSTSGNLLLVTRAQVLAWSAFSGKPRFAFDASVRAAASCGTGILAVTPQGDLEAIARVPPPLDVSFCRISLIDRRQVIEIAAKEGLQSELRSGWYIYEEMQGRLPHEGAPAVLSQILGWRVAFSGYDGRNSTIRFRIEAPVTAHPGRYVLVNEYNGADGGGVAYRFRLTRER